MSSTKSILALMLVGMGMMIRAEPQLANTYLPPDQGGYNYDKPTVTFPTTRPTGPPTGQTNLGEDHSHGGDSHVHMPGMPYDFAYAVKDDYYGTDYAHNAMSDGDVVKGEYRVQLPDGRLQIVRYTADWKTGFHADVQYEGEPQYPQTPSQNQNQNQNQGYNYPAPSGGGGGAALYGAPKTGY